MVRDGAVPLLRMESRLLLSPVTAHKALGDHGVAIGKAEEALGESKNSKAVDAEWLRTVSKRSLHQQQA